MAAGTMNSSSAKFFFCPYHALCSASVVDASGSLSRCSNLRKRYKELDLDPPNKQSTVAYRDPFFSTFCQVHRELESTCRRLAYDYVAPCNRMKSSNFNSDPDGYCTSVKDCFDARTAHKNKCASFTEDNGHNRARHIILQDHMNKNKCNNKPQRKVIETVTTWKQPYVIDEFNRLVTTQGGGRMKSRRKTKKSRSTRKIGKPHKSRRTKKTHKPYKSRRTKKTKKPHKSRRTRKTRRVSRHGRIY
jgi:hypothetical protein